MKRQECINTAISGIKANTVALVSTKTAKTTNNSFKSTTTKCNTDVKRSEQNFEMQKMRMFDILNAKNDGL